MVSPAAPYSQQAEYHENFNGLFFMTGAPPILEDALRARTRTHFGSDIHPVVCCWSFPQIRYPSVCRDGCAPCSRHVYARQTSNARPVNSGPLFVRSLRAKRPCRHSNTPPPVGRKAIHPLSGLELTCPGDQGCLKRDALPRYQTVADKNHIPLLVRAAGHRQA